MGQEASLPANGADGIDASLEEQARAPPSAVNPSMGASGQGTATTAAASSTTTKQGGRGSAKRMVQGMFHRGTSHNKDSSSNHHQHTSELSTDSFEQRESVRAAAAGGNIYLRDASNTEDFALQKMVMPSSSGMESEPPLPPQPYNQQQQQQPPPANYNDTTSAISTNNNLDGADGGVPAAAAARTMGGQQQSSSSSAAVPAPWHSAGTSGGPPPLPPPVGGSSSKKSSLFGGGGRPSARGVISSMRNLSIGGALRKQKEVQDWEKQWDEDEDEEEEESDEEGDGDHAAGAAMGAGAPAMIRPGMDAGHHSVPISPPRRGTQTMMSGMMMSAAAAATPPNLVKYPSSPLSPTSSSAQRPQQQQQLSAPQLFVTPKSPVGTAASSAAWGGTTELPQPLEDGRKPDVNMFLPMLRVLGKGSFGKVVLVQKREGKERGQLFAMKILKKTHLVKRRQIERTRTERKVLSVVNHPFIMKLHYAFQTPDKLYLVLDYCPGGELFFHLSRFRRFPERVARFYAAELLLAIGHLHKRGIIYRDLKPENVLLDADGHVKLGDFGLAKAGIQHPYEGATSMCGTPEYMAPEVLAQMGHGFCVDYWGLGMILYEMMTGLPPWYTTDRQQLFRRLKSAPLDIPSYFSSSSADCVSALLERNPRRRLGVTGIRVAMEHDFFRNIHWRGLYSRRIDPPVRPCEGWKPPEAVNGDAPLAPKSSDDKQFYEDGCEKLDSATLDTATANFDSQFTRMPVESEDKHNEQSHEEHELMEDLDENTFLGFSFDIIKDREGQQQQQAPARNRSQHYHAAENPHQ